VVITADLTLIFGAIDRMDCAINAYGCVMMELDDNHQRQDGREICTIKWLYEILRNEAHNVRGFVELPDQGLNDKETASPG
jgi:hypothetical protein